MNIDKDGTFFAAEISLYPGNLTVRGQDAASGQEKQIVALPVNVEVRVDLTNDRGGDIHIRGGGSCGEKALSPTALYCCSTTYRKADTMYVSLVKGASPAIPPSRLTMSAEVSMFISSNGSGRPTPRTTAGWRTLRTDGTFRTRTCYSISPKRKALYLRARQTCRGCCVRRG